MLTMRGIVLFLLLAIAASLIPVATAVAADAKGVMTLGTVDIDKAYEGYSKSTTIKDELQALANRIKLKWDLMKANKLLTDKEITELLDLNTKAKQEAADKARIEALLGESRKRDQELQTLEQKQDATEAEKARRQELTQLRLASDDAYKKVMELSQQEYDAKQNQLLEAAKKEIVDAVGAIAKEKGISIVFNKSIGLADFVVYSAVDITDDVVKRLNKK